MADRVIEINERTILLFGGCRLTIEPDKGMPLSLAAPGSAQSVVDVSSRPSSRAGETLAPSPSVPSGTPESTPGYPLAPFTRARMAARQAPPIVPFVPGAAPRVVSQAVCRPQEGDQIVYPNEYTDLIGKVVGEYQEWWFILTRAGVPAAVHHNRGKFFVRTPTDKTPLRGDVVFAVEGNFPIETVIGEAEVGGWLVTNAGGQIFHVLHIVAERWAKLQEAEI